MAEHSHNPAKLKAWRKALRDLADQITAWSESRHWLVRRDTKRIREERTGPYEVPVVTVQTPQGRIRVEPVGLDIVGAAGRVDIYAWPSLQEVLLVDFDKGWRLLDRDTNTLSRWNERAFVRVAEALTAAA